MAGNPRWAEKYNGIPFVESGFDEAGCHCWGLARLVIGRERGLWLPTYGEVSASELAAISRRMAVERVADIWRAVDRWQAFDVVLMAGRVAVGNEHRRVAVHCGVAVSSDHVLHVEAATAAVCVRHDHPSIRFRLLGAYRHHAL